ncbi:unnamed protein product [Sphagnum compactum]
MMNASKKQRRRSFQSISALKHLLALQKGFLWVAEKGPFLDMLQFAYSSKMMASSAEDVIAVWLLAQHFLADECAQHCLQLLHAMTPTLASCSLFLDLASVVTKLRMSAV